MKLLFLLIPLIATMGCGGGKKSSRNSRAGVTPVPSPSTDGNPDVVTEDDDEDVNVDSPSQVKASAGPRLKKFIFGTQSGDSLTDFRYLSEYLLVVSANQASCIKLAIRTSNEDESGDLKGTTPDASTFCNIQKDPQVLEPTKTTDSDTKTTDETTTDKESDTATTLRLAPTKPTKLAAASLDYCAERFFHFKRAETDIFTGVPLQAIGTKLAFLVSFSDHVNVWLDAEANNPCRTGTRADLQKSRFSLERLNSHYRGWYDQFTTHHFDNIASEAEKIYNSMVETYAAVSDIDNNGKIEIFITPEINRFTFRNVLTDTVDEFYPMPYSKAQDLKPFDPNANAASNEGEVVYVWAPDPGGIHRYTQYPSSNSMTSNYLKGYMAMQMMQLVVFNQDLARETAGKAVEESWLATSLGFLAAGYYGGNDYPLPFLAEYLSTRTQYLSLRPTDTATTIPDNYKDRIEVGKMGYLAMFGWYLHAKSCADTLTQMPCAAIKDLIINEAVGADKITSIYAMKDAQSLVDQFGLSVGLEMSSKPKANRDAAIAAALDPLPIAMSDLNEIFPSSVPQTYALDNQAQAVSGNNDRTIAGPFPSRKSMLYQVLVPDMPLELNLAKESVTYILVTGLAADSTEVKSQLGAGVALSIIPLGLRDPAARKMFVERKSESGHIDVAPINLTKAAVETELRYDAPYYASSSHAVTDSRELWLMGSIDNFNINVGGATTQVGDSDSYAITIDPCLGSGTEAACRASGKKRRVLVQVSPTDFQKELMPMFLVTSPQRSFFSGQRYVAPISAVATDDALIEIAPNKRFACFSGASLDITKYDKCANGQMLPATFQTQVLDKIDDAALSGMPSQSVYFNTYTDNYLKTLDSDFVGPIYDNFLFAGPLGPPIFNNVSIDLPQATGLERVGVRPFLAEEAQRQFLKFTYSTTVAATNNLFHPIFAGPDGTARPDLTEDLIRLETEALKTVYDLKDFLDNGTPPISDTLKEGCSSLGIASSLCEAPQSNISAFNTAMTNLLSAKKGVCLLGSGITLNTTLLKQICPGMALTETGSNSTIWLKPERSIVVVTNPADNFYSVYQPAVPVYKSTDESYCLGEVAENTSGTSGVDTTPCVIREASTVSDIRHQLAIPAGQFTGECSSSTFPGGFLACADMYSYLIATNPGTIFTDVFGKEPYTNERNRAAGSNPFSPFSIARQKGEYIGKFKTLHFVTFEVDPATESTIHLLIGGLNNTQGRYFARLRVVQDYEVQ